MNNLYNKLLVKQNNKFTKNSLKYFSDSTKTLERTSLYNLHKDFYKAKMVDFEGFDMPVQYSNIKDEHMACRNNAAVFDVSHMGQVRVHGKDRYDFLESLCVADLKELKEGHGGLTVFTNDKGGVIDDSIVTNMGNYLGVVFNAGRKVVDLENLHTQKEKLFANKDITIEHLTDKSLIAFQGPKAVAKLQSIVSGNLINLGFMEQVITEIPAIGEKVGIMRCGYTGEDGVEISVSNQNAEKLWMLLCPKDNTDGILPAALGARDTLRLEAGLCLYGHDMNEDITPVQASLRWLIGKRRKVDGGFKGFETIKGQISGDIPRNLVRVGFSFEGGPPAREGCKVLNKEGEEIGYVTSGTLSPCLKKVVGMCYVPPKYMKSGTELNVQVRTRTIPFKVTKMPFVPSKYYKKPEH